MRRRQFALAAVSGLAIGAAALYGLERRFSNACANLGDPGVDYRELENELLRSSKTI